MARRPTKPSAKPHASCSIDIENQRVAPSPMEPRSTVAYLGEGGRLTMRLSSQMPTGVRTGLCTSLGLAPEDVRVLVGDVGGGFGMKTGIYPEDIVVGHAARTLKRPVRWQAERIEEFLSAVHGRDVLSHAELALDAQGKVLGLRVRSTANVGAYATGAGVAIQVMIGPWVSTSIYDIANVDLQITCRAHQLRLHRPVSRRGTSRGDLRHRAADGRRGARDEARSRGAAPAQHGPARPDALQERGRTNI
jgi:CO/xanthine dehydrogenase Mo-binding subunit